MKTNTGRKLRADAKLEQLDEAQREQLHFWFAENFSYYEVVKRVQEKFGLSVGNSTVAAYWKRHIMPQRQQDDAEEVAALAALPAGDFNAAILQRVWSLAWDALARSHPDVDRATKLLAIVWKAERHALALKRLALEERRVAVQESRLRQSGGRAEQRWAASPKKRRGAACEQPPAEAQNVASGEPLAAAISACEAPNPPRSPGYSTLIQPEAEVQKDDVKPSKAQPKAVRSNEELSHQVQRSSVGKSAGVAEGAERVEMAAKAQSGEGRSEGPEAEDAPRAPAVGEISDTVLSAGSSRPGVSAKKAQGDLRNAESDRATERGELVRGMTPAQVLSAWGQPQIRGAELKDFMRSDFWEYCSEAGTRRVYFERGGVARWSEGTQGKSGAGG